MNKTSKSNLKITTEVVRRYYVEYRGGQGHEIFGGPFDTKEEAQQCLDEATEKGYAEG